MKIEDHAFSLPASIDCFLNVKLPLYHSLLTVVDFAFKLMYYIFCTYFFLLGRSMIACVETTSKEKSPGGLVSAGAILLE